MRIREHKGFGHGLREGQDSDLNCRSCKTENALGFYPVIRNGNHMAGLFAMLTDTENDTLHRKLFDARVHYHGRMDAGVHADLADVGRDLNAAMLARYPYGRSR